MGDSGWPSSLISRESSAAFIIANAARLCLNGCGQEVLGGSIVVKGCREKSFSSVPGFGTLCWLLIPNFHGCVCVCVGLISVTSSHGGEAAQPTQSARHEECGQRLQTCTSVYFCTASCSVLRLLRVLLTYLLLYVIVHYIMYILVPFCCHKNP